MSNSISCPTPAVVATRISHTRTTPIRHAFVYRSASWLIDIDHLPVPAKPLRPFARFDPADHFPETPAAGQTLRDRLTGHLTSAGVSPPAGHVVALLSPRVAGYVFNPLSVFWCHHPDGTPAYVVAEVHNTYGERHTYVVAPDDDGHAQVDKEFYVSPFNEVNGTYRLRMPPPTADGRITVSVTLERDGHDPFVAALSGRARPARTATILATQLRTPLAPLVVAARIRWHGIRLWLGHLPVIRRPDHSHVTTISTASGRKERR
ncbi:DUF1365 domain-containing protein [Streptomyces sp. SID6673]|nr:DUF1365 domain-containing protein [Streptomyces sp. SID11726]NEB26705.1 DUF1365 domain-containing protein [Streptomyces sp. SID6673]